jgi:iron-sulfur cluster repair protein YtfE (RIC family)
MTVTDRPSTPPDVANRLIRDLVDEYPDVMTVLAPLGIDLCCGGGHPLGEALDLHGVAREPVIAEVARIVDARNEEG